MDGGTQFGAEHAAYELALRLEAIQSYKKAEESEIATLRSTVLVYESELEKWVRFRCPTPAKVKQDYVVGFAFDAGRRRVCLIRKQRPDWQKGSLNGPGGHVEPGENLWQAMTREFHEECGVYTRGWELFCHLSFPKSEVYFFRIVLSDEQFCQLHSKTDELVYLVPADDIPLKGVLPNLRWLIPLALHSPELVVFGKGGK